MLSKHVENILRRFDIEPGPMDNLVDSYYRNHKNLGSRERRFISETVFGIMRWKRRLEGALFLRGIKKPTYSELCEVYLSWKEGRSELNFEAPVTKFPGGPSAYFSYPFFLYESLVKWAGSEHANEILLALNEPADVVLRVNLLKTSRDGLKKALKEEKIDSTPTRFSPFGLILKERLNLNSLSLFKDGLFEVQEEASQMVGLIVNPKQNELVIDSCAGAGGKTLLLAMLMENKGKIIASDTDESKLKILRKRARQAGVSNIEVMSVDKLLKEYNERADVLLLDAPCSGTGTLRRNPDIKWRLTETDVADHLAAQKKLLADYSALVKKGGRLIYSTCSILPQENEEVVAWFVKKYGWSVLSARGLLKIPGEEIFISQEGYFRTDPAKAPVDGFFASIVQRI